MPAVVVADPDTQAQGVGVVWVNDVWLEGENCVAECVRGAEIHAEAPRYLEDRYTVSDRSPREFTAAACHQAHVNARLAGQLPAQQPHLVLAAAPFAARIDLKDAHRVRPATSRRRARAAIHPA